MGIKNFISKQFQRLVEGNAVHPRHNFFAFGLPRTRFNYAKEVGTGLGSNVIMSPVQWVMRTFPESPVSLTKTKADGTTEPVITHPFLDLLDHPNDFYTYETMIMATMLSWSIAGNAYWLKVRNGINGVIQLWYVPHWMMTPKAHQTDASIFIDHYEYNPNGQVFHVPIEDVVHFRFGLDPRNVRLGLSPLGAVLREVFTDDEASNYGASILRNMGVPGVIISPEDDSEGFDEKTANEIKEKYGQSFTGDRRGEAMVMTRKVKVDTFAFDPKKLNLGDMRDISEERVTAALGIPAAVVGFGAGLQQTKVGATMNALIRLAWTGNIIPSQRPIGQTLQRQLLIDFDRDKGLTVGFDNSKVSALQEDKDKKIKRLSDGVMKGWAKVSDVREAEGLIVEESDRVYLRSLNMVEVD